MELLLFKVSSLQPVAPFWDVTHQLGTLHQQEVELKVLRLLKH